MTSAWPKSPDQSKFTLSRLILLREHSSWMSYPPHTELTSSHYRSFPAATMSKEIVLCSELAKEPTLAAMNCFQATDSSSQGFVPMNSTAIL